MQNPFALLAIALLSWILFGTFVLAPGIFFILKYGFFWRAIALGMVLGAFIGLLVGIVTTAVAKQTRSLKQFRSGLAGSIGGAALSITAVLWLGGFPKGTEADLALLLLCPLALTVGAGAGTLGGLILGGSQ